MSSACLLHISLSNGKVRVLWTRYPANSSLLQPLGFLLIKEITSNLSLSLSSNLDDVGSKSQDVSLCLEDIMEKLRHAFPSVRSSDVTANTLLAS